MKLKKLMPLAAAGVISAATAVGTVHYLKDDPAKEDPGYFHTARQDAQFAGLNAVALGDDFVKASKTAVPAVVTIKNYSTVGGSSRGMEQDLFDFFFGNPFGNRQQPKRQPPKDMPTGMGSGVIISPDGYIISNNHVVAGATKLEVILNNKKSYIATLVGTDPSTDIALLKIEEKGLPFLNFANSDNVEVGQWVLAVGNPLGLNSTVTAGIVSAKGRSIDLLSQQSRTPIESFIQTDAVINRGNSGGALININGDLVGINSAISSSTGYYEGYGFAVPSNLARKVVEDIKKFGLVQRGFLGVATIDLSNELQLRQYNEQSKSNLKPGMGMYVTEVSNKSGADDAGIRSGDVITRIDNVQITDFAALSLAVGSKRPGDRVSVTYLRNGKPYTTTVTLKDMQGGTKFRSTADLTVTEKLGAEFESLSDRDKVYFGLKNGVAASKVDPNGLLATRTGISAGYIITEVNGVAVNSQKDIEKILNNFRGNVSIKYLDDNGRITSRGFTMP
ncbi:MAG: PDZ domain-containing protein [Chryseobacterium sp.]|nr:MAG: PDZ domain-containing protein [Chryseobacterium sp.]